MRIALAACIATIVTLLGGSPAHANYAAPTNMGCGGYNAAARDRAGTMYMPCSGSKIRIVEANAAQRTVTIDQNVGRVAPSPTGAYLYTVDATGPKRFTRGADGNYRRDAFTFALPTGWAARGWKVCGWGVATDAYGYIYISNGGWCAGNPNQILKYRPNGSLVTLFGDYGVATKWYPCGGTNCVEWNRPGSVPGQFQPNMSIAVTHDGNRVWVADQNNQRVQVFERAPDNLSYRYRTMWSGEGTPWQYNLGAVYGVAVDPWGYGYVAQTTTKVIWRLDPEARNPVNVANRAGTDANRPHTLAVDARGDVWVGEWGSRYARTTAVPGPLPTLPPEPRPDLQAPVVTSLTAPAETTEAQVHVTITASDDIGVTQMRLADESGVWGPWQPYSAAIDVALSAGLGNKVIYLQVRDRAERESEVRWLVVKRIPVPDTADPVLVLHAPSTSTTSTVSLGIDASDDIGVTHLRIAGEDGAFSEWRSWASGSTTLPHELAPGYGPRYVAIQVRDAAFRVSTTASARIVVAAPVAAVEEPTPTVDGGGAAPAVAAARRDRVAPRIVRLGIPARSCSRRIVVRLAARDNRRVSFVRFANETGRFGRWRPARAANVHFLTRGYTHKVVYVQVRDSSGNVSRTSGRRSLIVRCMRRS